VDKKKRLVYFAKKHLGKPYKFGASPPSKKMGKPEQKL